MRQQCYRLRRIDAGSGAVAEERTHVAVPPLIREPNFPVSNTAGGAQLRNRQRTCRAPFHHYRSLKPESLGFTHQTAGFKQSIPERTTNPGCRSVVGSDKVWRFAELGLGAHDYSLITSC